MSTSSFQGLVRQKWSTLLSGFLGLLRVSLTLIGVAGVNSLDGPRVFMVDDV